MISVKENQETEIFVRIPIISKERLAFVEKQLQEESIKSLNQNMAFRIKLLDEKNGKEFFYDLEDTCIIGRRDDMCDIVLDYDRTVSSRQCKLHLYEGKIYITDLGGTNQTYLNNRMLKETTVLHEGDLLGLGRVDLVICF